MNAAMEAHIKDIEGVNTFSFYPATSIWDENTTWNTQPTYAQEPRYWLSFFSDEGDTWVARTDEFTDKFLEWFNGSTPNFGFYIYGLVEDPRTRQFMASSDNLDENMRPKLIVTISAQYLLSTSLIGNGVGAINSDPVGIACSTSDGDDCHAVLDYGTEITLTAVPESGSIFTGWEGDCTGTNPCSLTVTEAKEVTATFESVFIDHSVFIPLFIR